MWNPLHVKTDKNIGLKFVPQVIRVMFFQYSELICSLIRDWNAFANEFKLNKTSYSTPTEVKWRPNFCPLYMLTVNLSGEDIKNSNR